MYLSLSASGTPESTKRVLRDQVTGQLGTAPSAEKAAVGDAVLAYVDSLLSPDETAQVWVSGSFTLTAGTSTPLTQTAVG